MCSCTQKVPNISKQNWTRSSRSETRHLIVLKLSQNIESRVEKRGLFYGTNFVKPTKNHENT
jgi:hypothetical protein